MPIFYLFFVRALDKVVVAAVIWCHPGGPVEGGAAEGAHSKSRGGGDFGAVWQVY